MVFVVVNILGAAFAADDAAGDGPRSRQRRELTHKVREVGA